MTASNLHTAWARLLFRGLASSGVRHVVISPGSRSTPLVLAAAEEKEVTCHTIIDERSAAFFALGLVRATGTPAALLCTSGTAGAHYFPAIIEASESHLPLVVITADRPWEAYDVASPQTIDQIKLFGDHVRHFFDIGLPDPAALRSVPRIAAQAVHRARSGPVHVNVHFRKPLEPVDVPNREPWQDEFDHLLQLGAPRVHTATRTVNRSAVEALARACVHAKRGLIACGPGQLPPDDSIRLAVSAFALATGFPVLAEATSQVRFGPHPDGVASCGAFDSILHSKWAEAPDLLIEVGSTPVSSSYAAFVERHPTVPRWVISANGWSDPFNNAAVIVETLPAPFLHEAAAWIAAADDARPRDWARRWTEADQKAWHVVEREWSRPHLTEGAVSKLAVQALPEGSWLVLGNSGPVRDIDTYVAPQSRAIRVIHQRGVSGIDGLVSVAAGLRTVVNEPVLLHLGDVSMLHDLGGLAVAQHAKKPLILLVTHNDGGRIFEQLPISRRAELATPLERHFVTPHGLSFEHAALMFGIGFARVSTADVLQPALASALAYDGCTLIEAIVPPQDRQQLWRDIAAELA